MTRKECLDAAAACVLKDRNNSYGGPEDSFGVIANFWSVYLGRKVYPHDVAMMMSLLKIARIKANSGYADGYVDLAGYAACGAECGAEAPSPAPKDGDELVVLWKHKPEAESGCCQNGKDQPEEPEYEPHERVQVRYAPGRWCGAEYICRASQWGHVVFVPGEKEEQTFRNEDVRKWHKAEGCEDLVERDAPQTPAELYQRIVDCNPATFKAHKPTGEELAEMAEEEPHG